MPDENITYAKGRVVELSEDIEKLQIQIKAIKKSICSLTCTDNDIEVKEVNALLEDYKVKRDRLQETFKNLYAIQDKWGLR